MSEVDTMNDATLETLKQERDDWRQCVAVLVSAVAVNAVTSEYIMKRLLKEAERPVACEAELLQRISGLEEDLQEVRDQRDLREKECKVRAEDERILVKQHALRLRRMAPVTPETDSLPSECPPEAGAGVGKGKQAQGTSGPGRGAIPVTAEAEEL